MSNFCGELIIFGAAVIAYVWSEKRNRAVMSKFVFHAEGMTVVFKSKKYLCTRDNGKTLQLKGLRDMAWKGNCRPV